METSYRKVFAAIDGATTQEAVAAKAARIASSNHAALMFGCVVDALPEDATENDCNATCSVVQRRIEAVLHDTIQKVEDDPNIPSFEFCTLAGNITQTLHRSLIEPFSPDLVICGERGLSNVKYVFVGSVSTYLIRNLSCDVLVVKQRG